MGFDLYGNKAKSEKGEYFRNNIWWWRPLANYILDTIEIPENDPDGWHMNGGYKISARSAEKIAKVLEERISAGDVKKFEREYREALSCLPKEQCGICNGTGRRNDERVSGKCNACDGSGKCEAWQTNYPFSEENVKEFAEFCKESGGFKIY